LKLTKSDLGSKAQVKKRSLKKNLLSRLLRKDDIKLSHLDIDDMPYLWAGYRMGVWDGLINDGLDKEDFNEIIAGLSEAVVFMVIESNDKPLALVSLREDTRVIEPHIDWFPWAEDRDKLVGVVRLILDIREIKPVFIWSKKETKKFFTHIAKYGIIRRVGTFYSDEEYSVFQSKEA